MFAEMCGCAHFCEILSIYNYTYTCIQVNQKKIEYGEKGQYFIVTYFKKWNFSYILDSLHKVEVLKVKLHKKIVLIWMTRAYG